MRFIHTGDWHLGRVFHQVPLIEDQAHVLDQLVDLVAEEKPDAVRISGDIYDRAVPPTEAVNLLNDVLSQLVLGCGTQVILISGNHDSADRLQFGSDILAKGGLHVCGRCCAQPYCATIEDEYGPVHFYSLPYADPATGRELMGTDDIRDQNSFVAEAVKRIGASSAGDGRSVLIAHTYASGATPSESERPLSLGGVDEVDTKIFDGLNYVALGHLHCPQRVGSNASYAGSLLKYSFGEQHQPKSVSLVEIGPDGKQEVERVPLSPRRDVRVITGEIDAVLTHADSYGNREDYIQVILQDKGAVLDPTGKLREVFPNVLDVQRPALVSAAGAAQGSFMPGKDGRSALDYFGAFYKEVTSEDLSDSETAALSAILEQMEATDREAVR